MTTSFGWKTAGWFVYLMALTLAGEAAEVRLKARTNLRGPLVRLGDVAEITDEDPGIVQLLSKLPLFPAPAAGKQRTVARQEVQQILVMHEVNLHLVKLTGAEEIAMQSASGEKPTVASAPAKKTPSVANVAKATAEIPQEAPANMVQVAVAIRPLKPGETLAATDIELRPTVAVPGREPAKAETLVGKELKRGLSAGQAIEPDMLQSPRLVRRGELVTVRSIAPGIVVTARGRAIEEGGRGDLVAIELAETREKVLAKVSERQAVEIFAGGTKYETQTIGK